MQLKLMLTRFTYFILGLVEAILGLRFILRLFGANSANDFVSWVYDVSQPILEPFFNIFPAVRLEDGFVLELSTLFAMLVYALIAYAIVALIDALTPDVEPETRTRTTRR
jgi:uncharacterized protein YggT (Ycf19 family)